MTAVEANTILSVASVNKIYSFQPCSSKLNIFFKTKNEMPFYRSTANEVNPVIQPDSFSLSSYHKSHLGSLLAGGVLPQTVGTFPKESK